MGLDQCVKARERERRWKWGEYHHINHPRKTSFVGHIIDTNHFFDIFLGILVMIDAVSVQWPANPGHFVLPVLPCWGSDRRGQWEGDSMSKRSFEKLMLDSRRAETLRN